VRRGTYENVSGADEITPSQPPRPPCICRAVSAVGGWGEGVKCVRVLAVKVQSKYGFRWLRCEVRTGFGLKA